MNIEMKRTFVRDGEEIKMEDVKSGDEIHIYEDNRLVYRVEATKDGVHDSPSGRKVIKCNVLEIISYADKTPYKWED